MNPLDRDLRHKLESTVKAARDIAEATARSALEQLGVERATAFPYLSESQRELRRRLRSHGRQLGDRRDPATETQAIDLLVQEVAYEHWHRMLFARWLAESHLLMVPDPVAPIAVTLAECAELAADPDLAQGAVDAWDLAARFAAHMLPQIFRPTSPVFQVTLPTEAQQALEGLVEGLDPAVFTSSDGLGWVYQFWQSKRKDEVNAAEVKIGARELPAVTQLFTEPYMVSFLLDNALGAWWVGRRCGIGRGGERERGGAPSPFLSGASAPYRSPHRLRPARLEPDRHPAGADPRRSQPRPRGHRHPQRRLPLLLPAQLRQRAAL